MKLQSYSAVGINIKFWNLKSECINCEIFFNYTVQNAKGTVDEKKKQAAQCGLPIISLLD